MNEVRRTEKKRDEAWEVYYKARIAYNKAREAYDKADAAFSEAIINSKE